MPSLDDETISAPRQYRLAGEDAPVWLTTCFAVLGTAIALTTASVVERVALEEGAPQAAPQKPEQGSAVDAAAAPPTQRATDSTSAAPSAPAPTTERPASGATDCLPAVSVSFARNSAQPNFARFEKSFDALRRWMTLHPDAVLSVEGHTDSSGTEEYNLLLSERRAKAVVGRVVGLGIPEQRMTLLAAGASPSKGPPSDADHNRRVLLQVKGVATCSDTGKAMEER